MIINICEAISGQTTDIIANSLNSLKQGEKLLIYFSAADGGEIDSAEAIIHIINNNVDLIEIVAYGDIRSAGFIIFFKAKCHRIILPGCMGMFHQTVTSIEINESTGNQVAKSKADREWMRLQKSQTLNFCKSLNMTESEILAIKKGKDVYFQYPRMQEILKSQKY